MYAVLQLALVVGAVSVHGPEVITDQLEDDDAWRCETEGFNIIKAGPAGIGAFLDELQAPYRHSRSAKGPKAMYGRLYEWLAHECQDEAYNSIREIITDHAIDTLSLGPGDQLFNREIKTRRKHSIYSASKEFGLHPKRMRRILQRAELTHCDISSLPDHKVTFDSKGTSELLSNLTNSMSLKSAQNYLNVPRPHERGLLERGFIKPMITGGTRNGPHAFLKSELDAFLETLFRNADPEYHGVADMIPLLQAAKRACCPVMDVVALILDGTLSRVGHDPGKHGFAAILVDTKEVRRHVVGPDFSGHKLRDLEKLLPAKTSAVKALIAHGFLKTETIRNPITNGKQQIVHADELARFHSEFVSLSTLSREQGIHFRKAKKLLTEKEILPVANPQTLGLWLYRRRDLT